MDWEDLRYFSEVARTGSLAGAARALGVNHSTVFRRINRLEEGLGVKLFDHFLFLCDCNYNFHFKLFILFHKNNHFN